MPLLGTDGLDAPVLGDPRTRGAGRLPTLAAAPAAGEPTAVGNGCKGLSGTAVLHAPLCCMPGVPEGVSAARTKGLRTAEGVSVVRRAEGMSVVRRKGLC